MPSKKQYAPSLSDIVDKLEISLKKLIIRLEVVEKEMDQIKEKLQS